MLALIGEKKVKFQSRATALLLALTATVVVMLVVSDLSTRFLLLIESLSKAQLIWLRTGCLAFASACLGMAGWRRNRKAANDE